MKRYDIIYENKIILSLNRENPKQVSNYLKDIMNGKTEWTHIKETVKDIKDCKIRHTRIVSDYFDWEGNEI